MSVKIKLNRKGVREMLHYPEIEALITDKAKAVQSRAGEGYTVAVSNSSGKSRTYTTVRAEEPQAIRKNFKHNTLLKALGASHD